MLGWGFKTIDVICFTLSWRPCNRPSWAFIDNWEFRKNRTYYSNWSYWFKKSSRRLRVVTPELPFDVNLIEVSEDKAKETKIEINKGFFIKMLPVEHRITCFAYLVELERLPKFIPEQAMKLNIPQHFWKNLQQGETVKIMDKIYTPEMVLGEKRKGLKVAYCTDSRPVAGLKGFIFDADLFVCEGMYGDEEDKDQAKKKKHMIFSEAAELAKEGRVKELWLTHFSPALTEPKTFLNNALDIFSNTKIGEDRLTKNLNFIEENLI